MTWRHDIVTWFNYNDITRLCKKFTYRLWWNFMGGLAMGEGRSDYILVLIWWHEDMTQWHDFVEYWWFVIKFYGRVTHWPGTKCLDFGKDMTLWYDFYSDEFWWYYMMTWRHDLVTWLCWILTDCNEILGVGCPCNRDKMITLWW